MKDYEEYEAPCEGLENEEEETEAEMEEKEKSVVEEEGVINFSVSCLVLGCWFCEWEALSVHTGDQWSHLVPVPLASLACTLCWTGVPRGSWLVCFEVQL